MLAWFLKIRCLRDELTGRLVGSAKASSNLAKSSSSREVLAEVV